MVRNLRKRMANFPKSKEKEINSEEILMGFNLLQLVRKFMRAVQRI